MLRKRYLIVTALFFFLPTLSFAEGIAAAVSGTTLIKNPGQQWHILKKDGEPVQEGASLWISKSSLITLKAGNDLVELSTALESEDITVNKLVPLEITGKGVDIHYITPPLPPRLLSQADKFRTREGSITLAWSPLQRETLYHLQISTRPDFSKMIADEKTYSTDKKIEITGFGIFFWRVSAINKDGLEGGVSEVRSFEIRSLPEPPSLGLPASTKTSTTFRWKRKSEDERYHLQISRDKDFSETVIDLNYIEGPRITVGTLEEGDYFVRVGAIDEDGLEGRFSAPQPFYVGPKVPSTNIAPFMIMFGVAAMLAGIH